MNKIIEYSQKHSGTVLLNSILVLSVAIMIVGYSNSYLSEQTNGYRQLDALYKQQIHNNTNKSNKIHYREFRNP